MGRYIADEKNELKRVFTDLELDEISLVDKGAQEGARILITKRADDGTVKFKTARGETVAVAPPGFAPGGSFEIDVAKRGHLTTAAQGHSHLVQLDDETQAGYTSFENDHSHPFVVSTDGDVTIGEVNGHTHEIVMTKAADPAPADPTPAQTSDEPSRVDDNQGETMSKETKAAPAKAPEVTEDVTKAAADNVAVYKAADGREYRGEAAELAKQLDAQTAKAESAIQMAKEANELAKAAQAKAEYTELCKRAEEAIPHLPGTIEVRAALLKSVEGIEDEELREGAMKALRANNESVSRALEPLGVEIAEVDKTAEQKLESLAKKHAEENSLDYYEAYRIVYKANPELAKQAVSGS